MNNLTDTNTSQSLSSKTGDSSIWIDLEVYETFKKIIYMGVNPLLVICGIIGNVVALLILARRKQKSSTSVLLMCLAFWDLIFMLLMTIVLFLQNTNLADPKRGAELYLILIIPFNVYILPLAGRIENWLTAVISLERLVAVLFPMKVKLICTKRRMMVMSAAIVLTVAMVTIPKLYIYERRTVTLPDGNTTTIITLGSFGKMKKKFEAYYIASETLLRFLPMATVIICNFIIVSALCYKKRWRNEMTGNKGRAEELQITITLLTITFIFVLCLLPSTISRLMILVDQNSSFHQSDGINKILGLVGVLTECINSSVNVFIYVAFSSTYREEFRKLFRVTCIRNMRNQDPPLSKTPVYRISDLEHERINELIVTLQDKP